MINYEFLACNLLTKKDLDVFVSYYGYRGDMPFTEDEFLFLADKIDPNEMALQCLERDFFGKFKELRWVAAEVRKQSLAKMSTATKDEGLEIFEDAWRVFRRSLAVSLFECFQDQFKK